MFLNFIHEKRPDERNLAKPYDKDSDAQRNDKRQINETTLKLNECLLERA